MIEQRQLDDIWNYFLCLERDLENTSRYVEPNGQEHVYSIEFAKIINLSCIESESVFKLLCKHYEPQEKAGDIALYKGIILHHLPKIIDSEVFVYRLGKRFKPFGGWGQNRLSWWDAYQHIKHNRCTNYGEANYQNAVLSLSALYILILYLYKATHNVCHDDESIYLTSNYCHQVLVASPPRQLPDFEEVTTEK